MITLKDFMETINYRVTEGSDYGWNCYGSNAHCLSAWNGLHDDGGWSANVVFDTKDQTVYEVEVCDYTNNRAYRIINPDFKSAQSTEAKEHEEYANQAWDDINFTDLEIDEDWLDKACAIVAGEEYDTRVSIPLDLPESDIINLMKMAHEKDVTLNHLVENILRTKINELSSVKT
jgi:hypothetical protein